MTGDGSADDLRAATVSKKRAWTTVLVVLGLLAVSVVVALFLLRNELHGCFGGCGADGCSVGCSASNAPGP